MQKDPNNYREIDEKELVDLFSDDEERIRIIDQDEAMVFDDIIWDQQNVRLKNENIFLTESERQILILLNKDTPISKIAEIEQMGDFDIRIIFGKMCKKLCVKNQKEAYRRAKDLGLL